MSIRAEVGVHINTPLLQEPLRDVASVAIALAPFPQLRRAGVRCRRQSEVLSHHLKLRWHRRAERNWLAPVWVAAMSHDSLLRRSSLLLLDTETESGAAYKQCFHHDGWDGRAERLGIETDFEAFLKLVFNPVYGEEKLFLRLN